MKNFTSRSGQSLMELLIGMAVGAVLIIGSTTIITSSIESNGQVTSIQIQAQLGEELLNNTKAWAQGNWNALLDLATGTSSSYYLNTVSSPFIIPVASSTGGGGVYANGYLYSRSIAVNSSYASGTQTNFPMLISGSYAWLAASSSGGYVQDPNGSDIIFTSDSTGNTKLNWEVESYNSSTGNIVVWVNVPSFTPSTQIYLFYDNASVNTFQGSVTSTWNSNYAAVYHFPYTSSWLNDSTVNGNNATAIVGYSGNSASTASGYIDGGTTIGTNYGLNLGSSTSLAITTPLTLEAWANPSTLSGSGDSLQEYDIIRKDGQDDDNLDSDGYTLDFDNYGNVAYNYSGSATALRIGAFVGGSSWFSANSLSFTIATSTYENSWHDYVGTWDGSNWNLYIDGSLVASASGSGPQDASTTDTCIGGKNDEYFPGYCSETFAGSIDEPRISNVARSASWILTEYNNQSSPSTFYTIGSQTSNSGGGGGVISESVLESIVNNGVTYDRSFSVSDVYRDSNGNVTTTVSGNFDDPSTKLITASVGIASSTIPPLTYSMYITRNSSDNLDQKTWAGGSGFSLGSTFVTSTYAQATNTALNAQGALQIPNYIYLYSRSISVNSSYTSGTQTNFPMLVSSTYSWLKASSSGGYVQDPNGSDIIFTSDASGTTKLNWEVESYNSSTGNIVAWVNVPSLSSSTQIYAFYDNSAIHTFQGSVTSTWNSNYAAVYHFPYTSSWLNDSTVNGNNATYPVCGSGSCPDPVSTASGYFDGGTSMSGGYDVGYALNLGTSTSLAITTPLTLEAWADPSTLPGTGDGLKENDMIRKDGQDDDNNFNNGYTLDFDSYGNVAYNYSGSTTTVRIGAFIGSNSGFTWYSANSAGFVIATSTYENSWHDYVGTWDGSNWNLYIDGSLVATASSSYGPQDASTTDTCIGGKSDEYFPSYCSETFTGSIDEPRISNVARSASWILTQYNNESSPSTFYTIGSQTSNSGGGGPPASSTLDSQPFDTQSTSGGVELNSVIWQGSQPSGTTVKFQFAVSNSVNGPWNFVGPDGTTNTYFSGSAGTPINLVSTSNGYTLFDGYRYFSYRMFLYTPMNSITPVVNEVSVNWSP